MVQVALYYNEHVVNSINVIPNELMFNYCLSGYLHYIKGDDDVVDLEDATFIEKLELVFYYIFFVFDKVYYLY